MEPGTHGRMIEYFERERPEELERAAREYFGEYAEESDPVFDAETASAFFGAWFLYDYRTVHERKRPISIYRRTNPDGLTEEELAMIKRMEQTNTFDVFEVTNIRWGEGLSLRRLRTGTTYSVIDRSASQSAQERQALFCRVLQVGDHWELAGEALAMGTGAAQFMEIISREIGGVPAFTSQDVFRNFIRKAQSDDGEIQEDPKDALATFLQEDRLGDSVTVGDVEHWIVETKDYNTVSRRLMQHVFLEDDEVPRWCHLLQRFWKALPPERRGTPESAEEEHVGPIEQALRVQFLERGRVEVDPDDYESQEETDRAADAFVERWLDTIQEELQGKTPRQAVAEERLSSGRSDTEWTLKLLAGYTGDPGQLFLNGQLDRAIALVKEQKFKEAESVYKRMLEASPDNPQILGNLAIVVSSLGRKQEAIVLLERAVKLAPDYALAHENLEQIRLASPEDLRKQRVIARSSVLKSYDITKAVDEWCRFITSLEVMHVPAIHDAVAMQSWLQEHQPLAIHSKNGDLPRKAFCDINELLAQPDPSGIGNPQDTDFMRFAWEDNFPIVSRLHAIFCSRKYLRYRKKGSKLELTQEGERFVTFPPREQFGLLLWSYFREVPWDMFILPFGDDDTSIDVLQDTVDDRLRDMQALSEDTGGFRRREPPDISNLPETRQAIRTLGEQEGRRMADFARMTYLHDEQILIWRPLQWFGLVEIEEERDPETHLNNALRIRVTPLGKKILPTLSGSTWEDIAERERSALSHFSE